MTMMRKQKNRYIEEFVELNLFWLFNCEISHFLFLLTDFFQSLGVLKTMARDWNHLYVHKKSTMNFLLYIALLRWTFDFKFKSRCFEFVSLCNSWLYNFEIYLLFKDLYFSPSFYLIYSFRDQIFTLCYPLNSI